MLALPPGSYASDWILQVTRRSSEPDTSICLQSQPPGYPPASCPGKGCPPHTLNFSPKSL